MYLDFAITCRKEEALIQQLNRGAAERRAQHKKLNCKQLDRLEHDAVEHACRQHLKERGPLGTRVVESGAWILHPGQQAESSEQDILVTHAETSFSFPPLPKSAGPSDHPFSEDKNGVKAKYTMVPEGDILLHTEVTLQQ